MSTTENQLIIRGITQGGRTFRPSDWAQRLSTAIATRGPGGRIRFHPMVSLATLEGVNCVVVDKGLEQSDPMLYRFLLNFGRDNQLQLDGL